MIHESCKEHSINWGDKMNKKSLIGHVNFIVHGNRESKQIALTYDCDDYDYMAVPQILYILRKNSVKATFF